MLITDGTTPPPHALPDGATVIESLPGAYHALLPQLSDGQESLGAAEDSSSGGIGDTNATLASSETRVLGAASAPTTAPASGNVGDYILKNVSCMPPVDHTKTATVSKSGLGAPVSHPACKLAPDVSPPEVVVCNVESLSLIHI